MIPSTLLRKARIAYKFGCRVLRTDCVFERMVMPSKGGGDCWESQPMSVAEVTDQVQCNGPELVRMLSSITASVLSHQSFGAL